MSADASRLSIRRFLALTRYALLLCWQASWRLCLAAVAAQVLASAAPTAAAWASKGLVDGLGGHAPASQTVGLGALVVLLGGVAAVLGYAANLASAAQQRAVTIQVETNLYRSVNALRGLRLFEDPAYQDRLRLAQQAATTAPGAVLAFVLALVRTVVTVGGFVGVLIVVWWPMAPLLLLVAVPTVLGQISLTRHQAGTAEATIGGHRRRFAYQSLLTNPIAVKEVRLFGLGDLFGARVTEGLRDTTGRELASERRTAVAQSGFVILGAVVAAVGTMIVVARAARGLASAGDVVLFVSATAVMQAAFNGTIGQLGSMTKSVRLFQHFDAVVNAEPDLVDGSVGPGPLRKGIEFHDVWFRYDQQGEWVLNGLDLWIPAGGSLALVGANGAGKSTIVKLIARLYDPDRGHITWDGIDLRELSVEQLRKRIGAVFQDYMIYDLTAAENVGVGDVENLDDRNRIETAARTAGADRIIDNLPYGYDTLLSRLFIDGDRGQTGVALSGGQGQRVALARSLMRTEADLLILDEPSAGLDATAEHQVNDTLRCHRHGHTTVMVSHRLSAVREADVIAILDQGHIAELGTHDELMTASGIYASLFTLQASGYQDERVAAAPMSAQGFHVAVPRGNLEGRVLGHNASMRSGRAADRTQILSED